MEGEVITLQELFCFQVERVMPDGTVIGGLVPTGLRPTFIDKFERRGITLPNNLFQNGRVPALEEHLVR
jgi:pilus assembly protein CpaF